MPRASRAPAFNDPTSSRNGFSRRGRASPRAIASSIGCGWSAGGVQMSTKSTDDRRGQLVERRKRRTPGDNRTASARRSAVRSTTATIFASVLRSYAGQCPCPGDFAEADDRAVQHSVHAGGARSARSPRRDPGRIDDRQCPGPRRRRDERRMNAHARRVAHEDQAVRQALLEERHTSILRQQIDATPRRRPVRRTRSKPISNPRPRTFAMSG